MKKKPIRLIGSIGLISLIGFFSLGLKKTAAEDAALPTVDQTETTALTITPSIFNGITPQGKTSSQTFELKNDSHVPLPIKCYIRNFDASDEVGGVAIPEEIDGQRFSPRNWIEVVSPDFVIQSQTSHEITVNFNPPKDLPPGGYYAILFAEPLLPESFSSAGSLRIGGRLGSLLFLISPGDLSEKGKIVSTDIPRYIFSNTRPELRIRFQNEGNVHLKPSGKLTVTNRITQKSQTIAVPEFTVLPGKIRQENIDLSRVNWPGFYSLKLQLNYGRDRILIEKESTFIYLPWINVFKIAGVFLSVLFIAVPRIRKRFLKALKAIFKG